MELKLFIKQKLPEVSGVSQSTGNTWRKQEVVGQTIDRFPKIVVFTLYGDAISTIQIKVGCSYVVSLDIESRSYVDRNGKERWTTECKVWKAELLNLAHPETQQTDQGVMPAPAPTIQVPQSQQPEQTQVQVPQPSEDLPF